MAERTSSFSNGFDDESPIGRTDRDPDAAASGEMLAIRADIDDTRESISETLSELGERLNPDNLKEKLKDGIHEATIGRVGDMARSAKERVAETRYNVAHVIRENPVPVALVAVGFGWMIYNGRRRDSDVPSEGYRTARYWTESDPGAGYSGYAGARNVDSYDEDYMNDDKDSSTSDIGGSGAFDRDSLSSGIRARAEDVGHQVKERASELSHRAQDAARRVKSRAQDLAHQAADETRVRASHLADEARSRAQRIARGTRAQARRVEDGYFNNPLAFAAAALALGVVAGLAIPATRREARLMGSARDRVVGRVKEVAQDKKEKVKNVAEKVIDSATNTAREAAREQGLTS